MVVVLQRRVPPLVVVLIAAVFVTSLVAALDARAGGALYDHLALVPMHVWRGQVWRLVTWVLVERSPVSLLFAAIALYRFGGDLVLAWGQGRFGRFVAAIVLIAGVGTAVLALPLGPAWWFPHLGGTALADAVVIAWALQFPEARIRVYQVIEVGGPLLAYGTLGLTVLFAAYYGIAWFLPELLAGVAALAYMNGALPRSWPGPWRRGDGATGGRGDPHGPN